MIDYTTDQWLVVQLYYANPLDDFLVQAVAPFLHTVVQTGIASQYYYTRHQIGGSNIKLHIKGEQKILETILKPNLIEHFSNYFERYPSERIEPKYAFDSASSYRWQANDSIHFVDYLPDACANTNTEFQCIAERQYQASAKFVLYFLKRAQRGKTYEWLMQKTLKIHLAFAYGLGYDLEGCIQFFTDQYDYLIPHSFPYFDKKINDVIEQNVAAKHLAIYEQAYQQQRDQVIYPLHELWQSMLTDNLEQEPLKEWIAQNKTAKKDLIFAFVKAKQNGKRSKQPKVAKHVNYWTYFQLFFSNTNNRLGIARRDESLIAFFLVRGLEELKEMTAKPINLAKNT